MSNNMKTFHKLMEFLDPVLLGLLIAAAIFALATL